MKYPYNTDSSFSIALNAFDGINFYDLHSAVMYM